MTKYNLTPNIISDEESIKQSFIEAGKNVDKAEALVRSLGLSEFELHILSKRLSDE